MDHSPEEERMLAFGAELLSSSPLPVAVKKQHRHGLGRFIVGHKLRDGEIYCTFSRRKLRLTYRRPWKIRHIQQCSLISEALALLGLKEVPPFYLNTADKPLNTDFRPATVFGNCSVDGYADVAAPDFVYSGWPEAKFEDFDAKAESLAKASLSAPAFDRAFWMGRIFVPAREALSEFCRSRPSDVEIVDSSKNYNESIHLYKGAFMTMEEQVAKYRYMIDVEGLGYSGRLKLFLHAHRALLVLDRPYKEYFYDEMEPFRHYIPVGRYGSDILERIDWLRSNPKREAEIINEARKFARARLTRQKAIESWAKLLEEHIGAGGRLRFAGESLPQPLT